MVIKRQISKAEFKLRKRLAKIEKKVSRIDKQLARNEIPTLQEIFK